MSTTIDPQELRTQLALFDGSDTFYRWSLLFSRSVATKGVSYLAETAGCYWLLDYIASVQTEKRFASEPFQVWVLKKVNDHWSLACEDGNDHELHRHHIDYSDFPLPEGITLWACRNEFRGVTVMLPSEY